MTCRERVTLVITDDYAIGMQEAVDLANSEPIRSGESPVDYLMRLLGGAA